MSKKPKSRHSDYRAIAYQGYLHLPTVLTETEDFISLSGSALKLLIEIARQYNGHNNGDLNATLSLLKRRGWNSNNKISKALNELQTKNLIMLTRQGGMGIGANLYCITWQPINKCGGKLDEAATTSAPRSFSTAPIKKYPHPK